MATSFASVAKMNTSPTSTSPYKKDQGIILQTIEGIEAEDYVYALGDIINPHDIVNYSKISNGRIRIYMKTKQLAEEITSTYKTIKINNRDVQIRPLQTKSTRIIISNACPEIPHSLIEETLIKLGLTPTSIMIFLRAGLKKPGFEHILSARRCIYIKSNFEHLPETTTLSYEDTEHRIFIADDSAFCTYCRKHGHVVEDCKFKKRNENINDNTSTNQQIHQTIQQPKATPVTHQPQQEIQQTQQLYQQPTQQSQQQSNQHLENQMRQQLHQSQQQTKQMVTQQSEQLQQQLQQTRHQLEEQSQQQSTSQSQQQTQQQSTQQLQQQSTTINTTITATINTTINRRTNTTITARAEQTNPTKKLPRITKPSYSTKQ